MGFHWNTISVNPKKGVQVQASKTNAQGVLAPSKQAWPGMQGVPPPNLKLAKRMGEEP